MSNRYDVPAIANPNDEKCFIPNSIVYETLQEALSYIASKTHRHPFVKMEVRKES